MGQRYSSERPDAGPGCRTVSPVSPTEPHPNATTVSFYDKLYNSLAECPLSHKQFLPLDILRKMITKESVRANTGAVVKRQTFFRDNDLAGEVVWKAKKVFAILVLIGYQSAIGDLLSEGLTDEHLPLSRRAGGTDCTLKSDRDGGKTFETFRDWERAKITFFLEKQWLVQAPVVDTTGSNFILPRECALPLQGPIEHIGTTVSSKVFSCALYPAHYQQGSKAGQVLVAIKELQDQETFEREKDNLAMIQNLNNRHLIKHIATCQIGSRYYVIFPLANGGSLLEYWGRENKIPRSSGLVLWSLQQMLGLAGAICALHHDLDGDKHCRHGDLKPANILLFEEDEDKSLVIADLGVSRIHTQPTNLRHSGTTTMATTLSYESPEAYESERRGKPRPRTYDIWSIGCVFLEFAIWLLYDFNAIKNFETNRGSHENPHSSFYQKTSVGKAMIPSEVLDAIKALRDDPRCKGGTALEALVNLIANELLVISVDRRCNAEKLRDELQKIVQDVEQNPSYLLNVADQPSSIPKVFRPAEQASKSNPETQCVEIVGGTGG